MIWIMRNSRSFFIKIIFNIFLVGILLFFFNVVPIPWIVPCTFPLAQNVSFAIVIPLIIQIVGILKIPAISSKSLLIVLIFLLTSVLWLGSYPFSPLGFSSGQIPLLRGFVVTRFDHLPLTIASSKIVTMTGGSTMEIQTLVLPVDISCYWMSSNGGAFDDPTSCDTAYLSPEGMDFDIIHLRIHPDCHLPDTLGEIKVSIFPK